MSTNTNILGKNNRIVLPMSLGIWGDDYTNHHCRRLSIRGKSCEDHPALDNLDRKSKTVLVKQDLKDRTYETSFNTIIDVGKDISALNEGTEIICCRRCDLHRRGCENKDGYQNPNLVF
jgi:hypothetical protein